MEQEQKVREAISSTSDTAQQIDKIAEIRSWFRPEDNSTAYPIVQAYLDNDLDLTEAVNKLTEPLDAVISGNRLSQKGEVMLIDLWYSILHSAKRIFSRFLESHTKLVDLVRAIKEHPEPPHRGDQGVYSLLRLFGMCSRESMNDCPGCGAGYTEPEAYAYMNLQYFFARLLKADVQEYWIYVIWGMRDGLEEIPKDDGPNDAHKPGTAIEKYNAGVLAAAVWVFVLGKELYEKEEDLTPTNPNQGNPGKGGELWKGKAEFSKGRWALWKKRFGEVAEAEGIREETRKIARQAVNAMNASEKGEWDFNNWVFR